MSRLWFRLEVIKYQWPRQVLNYELQSVVINQSETALIIMRLSSTPRKPAQISKGFHRVFNATQSDVFLAI